MTLTTFQKNIEGFPSAGVAGDRATLNPTVYTVGKSLADGNVSAGTFVWETSKGAANTGSGLPLGFVERTLTFYNYDMLSGASMVAVSGSALTVARKGDYYAVSATAATVGQKVFAVLADGTLKTGEAGATISGAVETGWSVATGGGIGDLITITNWR